MQTNTSLVLKTMHVVFWIVFIGLCIKAGALLFSFVITFIVNPEGAKKFYINLNLFDLYQYSVNHFVSVFSLVLSIAVMKAYMAYLVIKIFLKLDLSKPFNVHVSSLISQISYIALGTGILNIVANGYTEWLQKKGLTVPLNWESSEFLFLAGIIFIIAQVFKRGIEIQTENELTV